MQNPYVLLRMLQFGALDWTDVNFFPRELWHSRVRIKFMAQLLLGKTQTLKLLRIIEAVVGPQ